MHSQVDRPHLKTIGYNMDDVNKRKFVHAQNIVFSTMYKEWRWEYTFIHKSLKKGRRTSSKNPYKVKPKKAIVSKLASKT